MNILIRDSQPEDMPIVHAIYSHYVLRGTASFEEVPPDLNETCRRRDAVLQARLPYLVAESGGAVIGYSYATLYRARSAYRYTAEDTVYVASESSGRGIGRMLLGEVLRRSGRMGYREMVAIIGDSANTRSIQLHCALGFRMVGTLSNVGFKLGRWLDTVIMQCPLNGG